MKVWIVCVLLCAAFTLRTARAAAIETGPEQEQELTAAAIETGPEQKQELPEETTELAVEELADVVENEEEADKADAAADFKSGLCPPGWFKYESRCFRLMRSSQSWLNAEAQCVAEQSRLASIHNIGQQKFLQNLLENAGLSYAWIGAYNFQGSWLWADTARFYYSNWYSLSSVSSYPCAVMRNNAGWFNTNCGSGYPYFCAIDLNTCYRT